MASLGSTALLQKRQDAERARTEQQSKELLKHADEVIEKFDKAWGPLERAAKLYRERLEGIRDDERNR